MSALATASQPEPGERFRSLELFGGVGGLALGLHSAGFYPVAVVDNDPECELALQANSAEGRSYTSGWSIRNQSASKVAYGDLGPVDLISAGAPCQPFSHAGRRRGDLDERDQFPEVVRAIRDLAPPVFLVENVRGLLFKDMELYFKRLLHELRAPRGGADPGIGRAGRPRDEYVVHYRLLNAADFGLPQNRLRLFIIGMRPELTPFWSWPRQTHTKDALLRALLEDDYWEDHGVGRVVRTRSGTST